MTPTDTNEPPQEILLFVDDEPLIADLFQKFMSRRGYQTMLASNATEAIQLLQSKTVNIVLVVTDLSLPVISGIELARVIKDQFEGLPVILATGYDLSTEVVNLPKNIVHIVKKPFQNKELAELIANILNPPPTLLA